MSVYRNRQPCLYSSFAEGFVAYQNRAAIVVQCSSQDLACTGAFFVDLHVGTYEYIHEQASRK